MAEEFEGGVIGGNWAWNSSRNLFGSSPCSLATNDVIGTFGWPNNDVMLTERSSDDSAGSVSDGAAQKPPPNGGFEMMSSDWSQDLLNDSGKSEQNYSNFLMNSNMNNYESQINSSSFPNISSSIENLSTGFSLNSASYNYTSSLLQTLFDTDSQPQQSLLDYSSNTNFQANSNVFVPNLPNNHLPNAPLWSANVIPPTNFAQSHNLLPSSLSNKMPNQPSFGAKQQNDQQKQTKKGSNEAAAAFKRPRIETPSPLPTFKVRKEKLGDRITALQQLVSPFGKTDTASVLHEAIEYIKFLHDQVNGLSTPYLKYGSPPIQRQQCGDKAKDGEVLIKDLNSRGLCLVPISSTFPVAAETPVDFWTPTFGGNLK